ncbi:MAG: RluA family pseudouridine synthase [Myxococcaceae bacterium]|nr:RluA family pseudouridine synthase [Myxococcaceae bacterium]
MESFLTWFAPGPLPDELPLRLNSPFDVEPPHPLVARAAEVVKAQLAAGQLGPGRSTSALRGPAGGKMFGVLVARAPDGRVGFLKAFSGQLEQSWDVEGWVPPVFDRAARSAVEPRGEAVVKALTARVEAARASGRRGELEAALGALVDAQARARASLTALHEARRRERHLRREALRQGGADASAQLEALARMSQADDRELRAARRTWRDERASLEAEVAREVRRLEALERLRRIVSQVVSWQLYDTYLFENARGQQRSLRALFAPAVPSSGTGDCAAPKLLVFARRAGLVPLGLVEFWWGAPPPGGGRVEGACYPACRDKCGPLLPFLLEGLDVAPSRRYRPPPRETHALAVLLEDERVLVVNKPEGLLSVPGTDASVVDSVLARVRARHPAATGPLLVHRLDVETSGLLLVALDADAYVALQRQFIERRVGKRYVAVLDGTLGPDEGQVTLPLRVDLEQRPRQLVDFEHGRPALTEFRVTGRAAGRTRVHLFPKTGRTHQLRVHAAHPRGLGLPIVGDRLYGAPAQRLCLHAERLEFHHPSDGRLIVVEAAAPF